MYFKFGYSSYCLFEMEESRVLGLMNNTSTYFSFGNVISFLYQDDDEDEVQGEEKQRTLRNLLLCNLSDLSYACSSSSFSCLSWIQNVCCTFLS